MDKQLTASERDAYDAGREMGWDYPRFQIKDENYDMGEWTRGELQAYKDGFADGKAEYTESKMMTGVPV